MFPANWLFELYFTHAVVRGIYSRPFVSIRGCSIGLLTLDAPRALSLLQGQVALRQGRAPLTAAILLGRNINGIGHKSRAGFINREQ